MKTILMMTAVVLVSMFMSCAIFIRDNDDDDDECRKSNSSKDTITIIYSQTKVNPLSVR